MAELEPLEGKSGGSTIGTLITENQLTLVISFDDKMKRLEERMTSGGEMKRRMGEKKESGGMHQFLLSSISFMLLVHLFHLSVNFLDFPTMMMTPLLSGQSEYLLTLGLLIYIY